MSEETFGQLLRRLRGRLPLREVARRARAGKSYIDDLERDRKWPSRAVVVALDRALEADGALIAAYDASEASVPISDVNPPTAEMGLLRNLGWGDNSDELGEAATKRRELLHIIAGLGATALTPSSEDLRQYFDVNPLVDTQTLNDWERACGSHLQALVTRPADVVHQDLDVDLRTVLLRAKMMADQFGPDHARTRDMARVVSAMSTLNANVLTRLGRHVEAERWWRTARQMADASDDLHLALGVRSTEAGHMLSAGESDAAAILDLIHTAAPIVARSPNSYGAALMELALAKTLSRLGRHGEAIATLERVSDQLATGRLEVTIMPRYWANQQLTYARAVVFSAAGKEAQFLDAQDQILAGNRDYQYPIIARLHAALCIVVCGGVEEGARNAAEVLADVPSTYRTHMIDRAGRMVIRAVPIDRQTRPEVRDLRSMLAIEA
ncbi:helix-turn-helix domain-containing protein [Nonomuraea turkmeniaca]|nr:helix-turn-helix transcriptional regulator [Nonomuraea turkmeniaca]